MAACILCETEYIVCEECWEGGSHKKWLATRFSNAFANFQAHCRKKYPFPGSEEEGGAGMLIEMSPAASEDRHHSSVVILPRPTVAGLLPRVRVDLVISLESNHIYHDMLDGILHEEIAMAAKQANEEVRAAFPRTFARRRA